MRATHLATTVISFSLLTAALCLSPAGASAKGHKGGGTTQPAGEHHNHKHKHKHKHDKGATKPSTPRDEQ